VSEFHLICLSLGSFEQLLRLPLVSSFVPFHFGPVRLQRTIVPHTSQIRSSASYKSLTVRSWDDWVPEDRLRKLSPENRELANSLRHEMLAAQRAQRAQPQPAKKKTHGSTRGSEDRQTSASAAAPRGQKRMRDYDLEKVSYTCAIPIVILLRMEIRLSCNRAN
jgi:hypothetical protein